LDVASGGRVSFDELGAMLLDDQPPADRDAQIQAAEAAISKVRKQHTAPV
jgi:hypothetical protein